MRFFLGMIVGALLLVAFTYLFDASSSGPATTQTADQRPMVNWDVVDRNWQNFTHGVRNTWNKVAER
jgi:hypothetical protein